MNWGLKTGPKGQKYRWFGYKLHLSVAAGSLFPLAALTATATIHDVHMARPLIKITTDRDMGQQVAIFDAGYDQATLYQDLQAQDLVPIIPLNRHGGTPPEGHHARGRPTCSMGYTRTLAGYDASAKVQKFRCPHATAHVECPMGMAWCSASNYGYVQKIAIADNPREVGRVVRGTARWDALYDLRTSVERAFSYLKEHLNLRTVRVRGRRKVHTHNLFTVIAVAASVLPPPGSPDPLRHIPRRWGERSMRERSPGIVLPWRPDPPLRTVSDYWEGRRHRGRLIHTRASSGYEKPSNDNRTFKSQAVFEMEFRFGNCKHC